jgi:hypothetical protein
MIKDIELRRLKDVKVKGNFTINCENVQQLLFLHKWFRTTKGQIKFKDITNKNLPPLNHMSYMFTSNPYRYIIKYESLNELLKLREIFNVRASKFDMELIKKRNYNPFTEDFYSRCADMTIYKVKK